jgi:hypothetical protein
MVVHLTPEQAAKLGINTASSSKPKRNRRVVGEPGLPIVCATCGEPCDGETAQTRHMAATDHHRFEAVIT